MSLAIEKRRVSPPRQARSRETYERILDALEELLRERRFEDITVRELVALSRTSTGSFYARFPTRETLLPALYDRYDEQLHERSGPAAWVPEDVPLEAVVRVVTGRIVRRFRERRWLTRAVALHARQHPELIPDEQRARRRALHASWCELLLLHRDSIGHPDPDTAVAFGLFMVVSAAREKIVFADAPHASSFELPHDSLAEELARALIEYLDVRPRPEKHGARKTTEAE